MLRPRVSVLFRLCNTRNLYSNRVHQILTRKSVRLVRCYAHFIDSKKISLVIFDKDGTLICFHEMWGPWATCIAENIKLDCGHPTVDLAEEVYKLLGFCPLTNEVRQGLLAEATMLEIRNSLIRLIVEHGIHEDIAKRIVEKACKECDMSNKLDTVKPLDDLHTLFETLKRNQIKIALCTADNRKQTETVVERLGVKNYFDIIVCGDDPDTKPKPDPYNALKICRALNVNPDEAAMIGDTKTDIRFGLSANLGFTFGVLSGIGREKELAGLGADHLVHRVSDIIPLIIKQKNRKSALDNFKMLLKRFNFAKNTNNQPISSSPQMLFRRTKDITILKPLNPNLESTSQRRYYSRFLPDGVKATHIIVGAGSAGCVLANRLTENPDNKVLLLEAGPQDSWWRWTIHMPSALMYNLRHDKYNWYYHTLPQLHMNERVMYWPRGKVWGGCSTLNAMVYIRGHAKDYDRWASEGAQGWSYAECLPYFKKSETFSEGANDYRGDSGPLHVCRINSGNPLYNAFIEAAVQAGYSRTDDVNGYRQEGFGPLDATVHKGKRWSASQAYLHPILNRKNLFIESNTRVTKIIMDRNRAVGVETQHFTKKEAIRTSLRRRLYCESNVILCGGAINSPQLLMLSGIGHSTVLKAVDVPLLHHLPGVGSNLQDHLEVYIQHACTQPITLYNKSSWRFPHNVLKIGLEWLMFKTGLGASNHLETGGFIRTPDESDGYPNVQFHFLPSVVVDHGRKIGTGHCYQVHVGTMRPTSRGWLKLRSNDPFEPVVINPNYLDTDHDRKEMRQCINVARRIFAQKAFDPYRGAELSPGADCTTDEQLNAFIRNMADSAYHPSSTCKMGTVDDPMSVVDPKTLLVHGSQNLMVVDASIMPSVISGNLNGPVIMMAEKAADIIMRKTCLPPLKVPVWEPK